MTQFLLVYRGGFGLLTSTLPSLSKEQPSNDWWGESGFELGTWSASLVCSAHDWNTEMEKRWMMTPPKAHRTLALLDFVNLFWELSSSNGILQLTGTKWRCNVCHKKLFNKRNFPLVSQLAQTRTMESQKLLRVFIDIFSNILVDKLIQSLFRLLVFSTPRSNSFWWFLVVILQRKAKNWTNNYNTCALCLYVLILAMTIHRHKKMFRYLSLILPCDRADTA